MKSIKLESKSLRETEEIGKVLARHLSPGTTLALTGPLAAGKTALSRSIFEARGYGGQVSSPTFTILNEYRNGENRAYHLDVYRLSSSEELAYTGYEDCREDMDFMVVEWAEIVADALPRDAVWILMDYGETEEKRRLEIRSEDAAYLCRIGEELHAYTCY